MTTSSTETRTLDGVAVPAAGTFTLDPAHTHVGFVARHLVVSKVRGSFEEVAGTITVADEPLQSSVEVTIGAGSITTGQPDRDNHIRSGDFLDLENHPNITFKSTRVASHSGNEFVLVGDLSIRGVTREVSLEVEFDGVATDGYGREVIAFTAKTEIDREDFGVNWNMALETGGVVVGKVVKIEITAEATRAAA
jgi:polyisoprenoid-binding protein YceI